VLLPGDDLDLDRDEHNGASAAIACMRDECHIALGTLAYNSMSVPPVVQVNAISSIACSKLLGSPQQGPPVAPHAHSLPHAAVRWALNRKCRIAMHALYKQLMRSVSR
jgi:hypothetical protein